MFHLDGQVTQNGIVEFECGFQFVQCFTVAFDVHQYVVSLGEFVDHVSQLTTAPVFDAMDFAAAGSYTVFLTFDHGSNLFALVRMNDKYDFIVTHVCSLWTLIKLPAPASSQVQEEENQLFYLGQEFSAISCC